MADAPQRRGDTVDAAVIPADIAGAEIIMADTPQRRGDTVDAAVIPADIAGAEIIMADAPQRRGDTVDAAVIMADTPQRRGDTVDTTVIPADIAGAEIYITKNDKTSSGDTVDGGCFSCISKKKKEDLCRYQMDFPSVGLCLIINNENFHPSTGMACRSGTNVDADALEKTFSDLGYKVIRRNDLTKSQMKQEMEKVAKDDHSQNASFICVILSHGKEEKIYGTDNYTEFEKLTGCIKGDKCKSLIGKPKLFFIQACRGDKLDHGTEKPKKDAVDDFSLNELPTIPVEADFLYAYATAKGYYAWRSPDEGSWFIQSLCEMLKKHRDLELMHILTRVNRRVAYHFHASEDNHKEIPCFTSLLTNEFYFPKST